MVKIKGLFFGYILWCSMDKDIEVVVRNCVGCQEMMNNFVRLFFYFLEYYVFFWYRCYVDFVGLGRERCCWW